MTTPGQRRKRTRIVAAAVLALALALGVFQLRYSHSAAWRVTAKDRPFVERAVNAAAADLRATPDEIRSTTRPIVWQHPYQVCVTLRTSSVWPDGTYEACHSRQSGELLSTRLSGSTFGAPSLWHRAKDWFWALIW